ncbi:MAG: dihydrolipoyl dehydrogenase [Clostridia bacterium]|jgi:dihydrolipoamide dehydrogenase|nr:dihydrolipoyl dehydrogenase [Clostridia bacterium]MBT7123156.1 dihydrolipoyl dehydrogenase [Clostridia bacterium]
MGNFTVMPRLGMTMTEGKIVKWLINEGDKVEKGDYLYEVETDKTTLEVDSLYAGILLKQYYEEGEDVPCDLEVGYIGEAGEEVPEIEKVVVSAESKDGAAPSAAPSSSERSAPTATPKKKAAALEDDGKTYDYDLAIIGGGPGGYVAALRAAQLGVKTVVIEKDVLGGACLNRGCIPTKALYTSAKQWQSIQNAGEFGFEIEGAKFDFAKIMKRKDKVVKQLTGGVGALLKKAKVEVINGEAKMSKEHEISVNDKTITCKYAILATGSSPLSVLRNVADGVEIYNTDKLMGLKKLPKTMVIVGGGIIGCEIGCIMNSFGVDVTIVELLPSILPMVDDEVATYLARHMSKNGIKLTTGVTVDAIRKEKAGYTVIMSDDNTVKCDMVLEAVGRKVNTDAFEALGVDMTKRGFVNVDEFMCTNLRSVYAIGDMNGICQLAHAASEQGVAAVERLFDGKTEAEEQNIPSCVFTDIEIAYIGLTKAQAESQGIEAREFKFPFAANGKALTMGESEGFIKVVTDPRFGEILGVHIIGPEASTLIHEAAIAMRLEATAESAGTTVHAHPTLSEAMSEAFLGSSKGALHI